MSSVLRTYARSKHSDRSRKHRRGGCVLPVMLLLALAAAWAAWVTRDTSPSNRFIAADRAYEIYASDFLNKRARLADAKIWSLLPADLPLAANFAALTHKLELPEWVLNNVAYSTFHVSGRDLEQFSDPLLITRMSRIGCLLERFQRFSDEVTLDPAGGLNLQSIEDGALFYAVRGRILLVSPDRDALIRALTLTQDQCAQTASTVDDAPQATLGEAPDLHIRIRPAADSALRQICDRADIGLFAEGTSARLDCRIVLGHSYRARLAPLLSNVQPATLLQPPAGIVALSANFGRPLTETWRALRSALEDTGWFEPTLKAVERFAGDRQTVLGETLGPLLSQAGPRWAATWHGFDYTALLPAPQLTALAVCDAKAFDALVADVRPQPSDGEEWPAECFLVPDSRTIIVPMPAGPSFTPTMTQAGEMLLLGTGQDTLAEVAGTTRPTYLDAPGNLHVVCAPTPLVQTLREAALELAEAGLLRGQTPGTVATAFAPWMSAAGRIRKATFSAAHEEPSIHMTIALELADGVNLEATE